MTGSSSHSASTDRVHAVVEPAVASAGLVLESVTVTPAGRRRVLRITVDLPGHVLGGVPMDAVSLVSQTVSRALDDSDVMGAAPYVLEVSSPGLDRPLTQRRHWERARTRLVLATLTDQSAVEGRLAAVDDDGVQLGDRRLAWTEIARGRMQVDFSAPELSADVPDGDGRNHDDLDRADGEGHADLPAGPPGGDL
jgi:ribosome maturation factor RimP